MLHIYYALFLCMLKVNHSKFEGSISLIPLNFMSYYIGLRDLSQLISIGITA